MASQTGTATDTFPSVYIATAGYDHTIRLWEALNGVCYRTIQHPDSQVNCLAISPDKKYIAAAGNPHIRFFEALTTNPNAVTSFDGHVGSVTSIGFQSQGKWMYSSGEDGTVKIWDLRTPGCQRDYEHRCPVNSVVLHPNKCEIISADQKGRIKLWDLRANQCVEQLIPEEDVAIRSISVSHDGRLLAAANSKGHCYIWESSSPLSETRILTPLQKIEAHADYVLKCLFSPDGSRLATTSSDQTIKLWHTDSWTLDKTLTGHQRWVWDVCFSADSAYLLSGSSDNTARLWDVTQGVTVRQYSGHQRAVVAIALNDEAVYSK